MAKVNTILQGDVIERLQDIEDNTIQCVVTSPPYWGLRDYGEDDQLGLEETPEEYVDNMVKVFREVRRTLKDDGTLWLNLGDTYVANKGNSKAGFNERYFGKKLKPINKVIHIKIPILQLKTQMHPKIL
jgi:DNA modification methylase